MAEEKKEVPKYTLTPEQTRRLKMFLKEQEDVNKQYSVVKIIRDVLKIAGVVL